MRLLRMLAVGVCLAAETLAAPGCPRTEKPAAATPPEAVYTVRGRIESLPDPSKPASDFRVHHEAIDNFVGLSGKLGMDSMPMSFPLAKGVSLEEIKSELVKRHRAGHKH